MRQALWEKSRGALAALLNGSNELVIADLYTFTMAGGSVLRYSGADMPVTIGSSSWVLGPLLLRSRLRCQVGVEVSTLDLKVVADDSLAIAGTPLLAYIARGGFDNARLQLDRAYYGRLDRSPVGTLAWFSGRVAETRGDRLQQQLRIKSDTELLEVMVPRELYQGGCLNTLYDSACAAKRSAYTVAGVAASNSDTSRTRFDHDLAKASAWFDLGVVEFTSGANDGIARTVKRFTSTRFELLNPFPFDVDQGDRFTAVPGCAKTRKVCDEKFHNLLRFRGHPYIPVPETVT